jgi:hypothetical protein
MPEPRPRKDTVPVQRWWWAHGEWLPAPAPGRCSSQLTKQVLSPHHWYPIRRCSSHICNARTTLAESDRLCTAVAAKSRRVVGMSMISLGPPSPGPSRLCPRKTPRRHNRCAPTRAPTIANRTRSASNEAPPSLRRSMHGACDGKIATAGRSPMSPCRTPPTESSPQPFRVSKGAAVLPSLPSSD